MQARHAPRICRWWAVDLEAMVLRRIERLTSLRGEIVRVIDRVSDPRLNEVLKMRYLDLLPWAVKMTFTGTDCIGMEKITLQ